MKLLIFIYSLSCGGAERVTANVANHWIKKGWNVTVVTLTSGSLDFYRLDPRIERIALGLATDSAGPIAAAASNLRRILALRRVLRRVAPDVALAMMNSANVLLAISAVGVRQLAVVGSERVHPPQVPLGCLWESLRRLSYGWLDAVAALTHESREWLTTHTSARRVAVIPNPVALPLSSHAPVVPVPGLHGTGSRVLLAVGRLVEQKGFGGLIQVFSKLATRHRDWHMFILGEGGLRDDLQQQIVRFGLSGRVHLPGHVGNLADWYATADLYVLSSRFEGFPNTLAEAMAHGLPVVSFDCDTGPRDIIRNETDGLLVPPGDLSALEAALDRLMGDEVLRKRFGERATEVRERFSLERIAGLWEALFLELTR